MQATDSLELRPKELENFKLDRLACAFPGRYISDIIHFMRPIWETSDAAHVSMCAEELQLRDIASRAREHLVQATAAARRFHLETETIDSLVASAETDLRVGCEVAASGYFKQAYALWRSWFEQTIFALYFLEAPLHREAWLVVSEIDHGKEPQSKLMLHEMLAPQHPFRIAYQRRFSAMNEAVKLSYNKKADEGLELANRCLRDFSQGVHGTFNPTPISAQAELPAALARHALPTIHRASVCVGAFCFVFAHALFEPTEQQLLELRSQTPPASPSVDDEILRPLTVSLENWLTYLRTKGQSPKGGPHG